MSIQAYDADMVEAPGAEALASGALASLWASFGGVWPLWSILTVINAVGAALAEGSTEAGTPAGLVALPSLVASTLGASVVSGVAIRLMLGRGKAAWLPDLGLIAYVGLVSLLTAAPSAFALTVQAPPHGATQAAVTSFIELASVALLATIGAIWATLRLTLWPIGRLLGNAEMTAGRSWRLMRGAVLRYLMGAILLGAPVAMLNFMVITLTKSQGHLISQIAATPLNALIALLAAAVAAEVYRARVVVAPSED